MNFWANKLNGAPVAPSPKPSRDLYTYTTPTYTPPTVPGLPEYTPTVRLIQGSTCPGCGSTNYRPPVNRFAIACPDCGYHPRFEQSGYGQRSLRTEAGQATPARQPTSTQTMQGSIAALNAGSGEHI